jgi:peptidoglycan/LPS O-acetylase OafA/YrhL
MRVLPSMHEPASPGPPRGGETTPATRRPDLDWIRVLAIGSLLLYHTALIFGPSPWLIQNPATSRLVGEICYFFAQWRMPLMFLVAGVAAAAALERRTAGEHLAERARRLGVPLAFGVLTVVPPQIYLHRVAATGESFGSFYEGFLQHMLTPSGVDWQHLWFVAYLIVADLVALPLFLWWRGRRATARQAWPRALAGSGARYLALPPVALVAVAIVAARGLPPTALFGAVVPREFLPYLVVYVAGFALAGAGGAWELLERNRRTMLAAAVAAAATLFALRWGPMFVPRATDELRAAIPYWAPVNSWCWVAAALGYARRHLAFENAFLRYAREASYPVYILHQAVIVVLGAAVIRWDAGAPLKFVAIAGASTIAVLAAYEVAIRPHDAARFVFGLKPRRGGAGGSSAPERGRQLGAPAAAPQLERTA